MKIPSSWLLLGSLLSGRVAVAQTDIIANRAPEQWMLKATPNAASVTEPVAYDQCFLPAPELVSGGGDKGIADAIQQRLSYPPAALQANVQGRVFASFLITPAGNVQDIQVIKSLRPDCDTAVVHAVRLLPGFRPRLLKYGSVRYIVPVTFRIPKIHPGTKSPQHRQSK